MLSIRHRHARNTTSFHRYEWNLRPPSLNRPRPRLRIGFLLSPRFTLTAFASFVDVLRLAADEGDRSRQIVCQWNVLASRQRPVVSSCGISVYPDKPLAEPGDYDYIAVVGGLLDSDIGLDDEEMAFLSRAAAKNIPLIGLCTGAIVLQRAGLMDGYQCCVSWFHHEDFLMYSQGAEAVSDRIYVVDRDRLTCSGGSSSAYLAAHLVEKHVGLAQARKSLRILMIDDVKEGHRAQPGIPLELSCDDDLVRRCLTIMQQNLSAPWSVKKIAAYLDVDRRKVERHFKAALQMTPARANQIVRLNHAKSLLVTCARSVTEISDETGYCNPSHFVKAFRDKEGVTPTQYRQQQTSSVKG